MSKTYNFNPKFKIWKAADGDGNPVLGNIYINKGYAFAGNGHIAVRIPMDEFCLFEDDQAAEMLENYCIDRNLLKDLMKYGEAHVTDYGEVTAKKNGFDVVYHFLPIGQTADTKMPNFDSVFKSDQPRKPVQDIGIKTPLLNDLASAMGVSGAEAVKMTFTSANKVIFVENNMMSSLAMGVIMPVLTEPALPGFGIDDEND